MSAVARCPPGWVYFAGVVRGSEDGAGIRAIDYEAFEPMVRRQFELIFVEMENRWPIESVRLVHRLGVVAVNEPSLWVEVIAPHRGEAFAAGQFLDRKSTRLNSSHERLSRMPSSA